MRPHKKNKEEKGLLLIQEEITKKLNQKNKKRKNKKKRKMNRYKSLKEAPEEQLKKLLHRNK